MDIYIIGKVKERLDKKTTSLHAELRTWTTAVVYCFAKEETIGGHWQNLYLSAFVSNLKMADGHNGECVCVLV